MTKTTIFTLTILVTIFFASCSNPITPVVDFKEVDKKVVEKETVENEAVVEAPAQPVEETPAVDAPAKPAEETPAAISSLGTNDMKNIAPAYEGDTIRNRCTVIDMRLSKSKQGMGILKVQSELINQEDKVLFSYVNTALYLVREAEDQA